MSLYPCSACAQRKPGKYAAVYSAWFNGGNERIAQRQRFCLDCMSGTIAALIKRQIANGDDMTICPACGEKSEGECQPVYMTIYLPKAEPLEYALPICDGCAVETREYLRNGSLPLEDRGVGVRGPSQSATLDWAAQMGLT